MNFFKRRTLLKSIGAAVASVFAGIGLYRYFNDRRSNQLSDNTTESNMIKRQFKLDFQWPTLEPFLFCVHHNDDYPAGTKEFGPDPKYLEGRDIGQDFEIKDGFRMYHGDVVPGFPVHPHRGFETITIVRKGFADHADSMGAAGRYGQGDVQWMTAGSGVQHSEMFPLIRQDAKNTVELFQIWLNLPRVNKMAKPHFTMFWSEKIPQLNLQNGNVQLTLIAGEYDGVKALTPPPESWASREESDTAIWLVKMKKGAEFLIPKSRRQSSRMLYFFEGDELKINGNIVSANTGLELDSNFEVEINSDKSEIEFLMLQSKSIGEPVVQHGPFVMNSREEIIQTFRDYEKTQFGGWPWPKYDPVHGGKLERFAQYPDGKIEKPNV